MTPQQRLAHLLNAIRTDNHQKCEEILTDNPDEIINLPSNMNEQDIQRLIHKTERSREFLVPRATTGCTPIFYAALYNYQPIFELLHQKGATLDSKTAGEIDLAVFCMGCGVGRRIIKYWMDNAVNLLGAALINPDNPFKVLLTQTHTSNGSLHGQAFTQSNYHTTELEYLIFAILRQDLEAVNECLQYNVHLKDTKGAALGGACSMGNEAIARVLLAKKVPISLRHYFTAGIAGDANALKMYNLLKGDTNRAPTVNATPIPDFISGGQLQGLVDAFKTNPPDAATQSRWLYYSLHSGYLHNTRFLLEKVTVTEAKHYYAAGRMHDVHTRPSQYKLCSHLLDMLEAFDAKLPLPDNFFTPAENAYYLSVTQGIVETNNNRRNTQVA